MGRRSTWGTAFGKSAVLRLLFLARWIRSWPGHVSSRLNPEQPRKRIALGERNVDGVTGPWHGFILQPTRLAV